MLCDVTVVSDLYRLCGNPQGEAEGYRLHDSFTQALLKDHFQSSQLAEHRLIQVRVRLRHCATSTAI